MHLSRILRYVLGENMTLQGQRKIQMIAEQWPERNSRRVQDSIFLSLAAYITDPTDTVASWWRSSLDEPWFALSCLQDFAVAVRAFWRSSNATTPLNNLWSHVKLVKTKIKIANVRIVLVERGSIE
jgi:hypothetical protein